MPGKKHRIAATFITNKFDDKFERAVQSVAPYVDGVFVNYNGPEEKPGDIDISVGDDSFEFVVENFKWEDNFSLARNQVFAMVPKEEYDWYFWMDSDDTLEGGENLQDILNGLDSETQGVFFKYEYGVEPETGKVLVEQWRERLLRTDGSWRWDYPIHEVCHAPPGTQYAYRDQAWIRHHRTEGAADTETRARNRRILVKARQEEPNEPRHDFYFANEVFAEAAFMNRPAAHELLNAAIKAYKDFIVKSPSIEESYLATHRVAECYRMLGDDEMAINWELQCLKVLPLWPEAYLGISQSLLTLGDPGKAKAWADLCLKLDPRDTQHAIEPLNSKFYPHLIRGLAFEELGEWEAALADLRIAQEESYRDNIQEKIEKIEGIIKDKPETLGDLRKTLRNTRLDKSIAFVTRPTAEPWHPELEKQGGIGGSETCIMELAKRFAADDWRVAVFGSPGFYMGEHEGVEWWDASMFNPTEKFKVMVSSRTPEIFDANIEAENKFLWMHDVNVGDQMSGTWGNRLDKVDKVIGLTKWHVNHLQTLYNIDPSKMAHIPNGIDLSRFGKNKPRQAYNFVYSSSPDRGLDVLLGLWPAIKRLIPEAELNVYYGWSSIDAIIKAAPNNPSAKELLWFKNHIMDAVERLNVSSSSIHIHGRIPQSQLSEELSSCFAWLYPTYFMETFCITALEMQMAGVIPIVSDLAALHETVAVPELRVPGYPRNSAYQNYFLNLLQDVVEQPEEQLEEWRAIGKEHASKYNWDSVYNIWQDQISEVQGKTLVTA